jgi:replicative DNA helicase Mcm
MEQQSYHPLTEIQLADGRKVRIGEFVDRMMANRPLEIIPGKDCEILPLDEDIKIKSTDMSRIFDLPVDRVSRHRAPDHFIAIAFSNGKEILVTPEHPVYVAKDGIACIPACQIKAGDIAPAPKSNGIGYLKIIGVKVVANKDEHFTDFVYDVTIEPTHTFVSQGLILHNTISVAKAGVMATLKSRCSLLAAANPKLGRFDKYEPIAPQINLTPALMSRFDLIFVLTDDPDTKRDSAIAQHILKSNYAGELATQAAWNQDISQEDIDNALMVIMPVVDPEMLRKYVAYARKNIFPTLSEEAKEYFLKYYVGLRSQGQDTNKPVPVTARQLEALIRLGEASARLRLSDKVTLDDAKRVVKILEACLRKVGVDPETGFLDADIIASGTTKSTRDRTKSVIYIIRDVSREQQGPAPRDAVLDRAEELGIERAKAEEIIDRMRRDGDVFEPRPGMLKLP